MSKKLTDFQQHIWDYYRANRRDFPWRRTTDPYHIFISEVMLQQTQTFRVEPKFNNWIAALPTFQSLADAPLREVLSLWQGLGYNRRALWLHQAAQRIMTEFNGELPINPEILETFPGIGPNTAASVCAFAFNKPTIFIETNIRAVFIHFFFTGKAEIKDNEIRPLVEQTVDQENPREWYYALMDYGVMLKKNLPNPSRRSAHHAQQTKFEGSERQIRGLILKSLTAQAMDLRRLTLVIDEHLRERPVSSRRYQLSILDKNRDAKTSSARIRKNLEDLCAEGFIEKKEKQFSIR